MTTSASTAVPSDHRAPIAIVDNEHHGAWTLICAIFGLITILIALLIRIYIRVKVSPPFGRDDILLACTTALAFIQTGIVLAQVGAGYGGSIDLMNQLHVVEVQKLGYAADVLFLLALYASKCCVILFFARISPSRASKIFARAVLSGCLAFVVASILMVSLRCNISQPWLSYGQACTGLAARSKAVAALDIASEVALFAMSLHLVWDLQTSISRKSKVVFAFALRLLVIAIASIRLRYIERQIASSDPTLAGATTAVLTQTELFYSIVGATIPCLRPFLAAFVTNYGAMGGDTVIGGSQVGASKGAKESKGSNNSFALRSIGSARLGTVSGREKLADHPRGHEPPTMSLEMFRPDPVAHRISAGHGIGIRDGDRDASSIEDDESTKGMIIRKEVAWQVDSESCRTKSISGAHGAREAS